MSKIARHLLMPMSTVCYVKNQQFVMYKTAKSEKIDQQFWTFVYIGECLLLGTCFLFSLPLYKEYTSEN